MAMQKVVVEGLSVSAPQLKDLFRQIDDGSIGGRHIQALLEHRDPFAGPSMELADQLARWQALFDSVNIDCDVSELTIPQQQPGFDRLIVVPKGLMMNKLVEIMRKRFDMWLYIDDLDKAITKNDRLNEKSAYAIWVRDRIEADEELKSMSANEIAKAEIVGITAPERLLYGLVYFHETGKHLDIKNVTLCTGSRLADGRVLGVYWHPDNREVSVGWFSTSRSYSHLRARAVVS